MGHKTIEVDIRLTCKECGRELEFSDSGDRDIDVRPCETCLQEEYDDAFKEGKEQGDTEGYERGLEDGKEAGTA